MNNQKGKIEWCDFTVNPIKVKGGGWHCTKISSGCNNCYAEGINMRFGNQIPYDRSHVEFDINLSAFKRLPKKRSCRVFVQSMGDLLHDDFIKQLEDSGGGTGMCEMFLDHLYYEDNAWLITTKRPQNWDRLANYVNAGMEAEMEWRNGGHGGSPKLFTSGSTRVDFNSIHLGVSVEDQKTADERIPILLQIPAAVRWISAEPLLGELDLTRVKYFPDKINTVDVLRGGTWDDEKHFGFVNHSDMPGTLDWVIVGAESGAKRRPCKMEWVEKVVQDCHEAGVPCFVKQISLNGKVTKDINQLPEHLRIREIPNARTSANRI